MLYIARHSDSGPANCPRHGRDGRDNGTVVATGDAACRRWGRGVGLDSIDPVLTPHQHPTPNTLLPKHRNTRSPNHQTTKPRRPIHIILSHQHYISQQPAAFYLLSLFNRLFFILSHADAKSTQHSTIPNIPNSSDETSDKQSSPKHPVIDGSTVHSGFHNTFFISYLIH